MTLLRRIDLRLLPVHLGIIAVFMLIPVWYRLEQPISFFPSLYVTRFLIFLPMVWAIAWWLIVGLPGFRALRKDEIRAGWALALLLLALWAIGSNTWAFQRVQHPEVGETAALQFAVVALFAVVVACAAPPHRVLIAVLVIGLIGNTLVTVLQVAAQSHIGLDWLGEFELGPDNPGASVVVAGELRWLRPYGLLPHPNMLAGILAVGLFACGAWIISARRSLRWLGTLIFVVGLWAFMLTFSRAAWLAFAAASFAVLPILWRSYLRDAGRRRQIIIALGLAVVIGTAFVITYRPLLTARSLTTEESVELRSISDRLVFIDFAQRAIDENPIIGVGMGNFPWRTSYYLVPTGFDLRGDNVHHVLLSAWAELGLVGIMLMVTTLALGLEAILRSLRVKPDANRIALLGGFLVLALIGLLDHYPWSLIQTQTAWWGLLAAALSEDRL